MVIGTLVFRALIKFLSLLVAGPIVEELFLRLPQGVFYPNVIRVHTKISIVPVIGTLAVLFLFLFQ